MSIAKRFFVIWVAYIILALGSISMPSVLRPIATPIGSLIPAINHLNGSSAVGKSRAFVFFGIFALVVVPMAIFMTSDGTRYQRIHKSIFLSGRSPLLQMASLYFFALPVVVLLFAFVAVMPLDSTEANTAGSRGIAWLLEGGAGLVLVGSFLASGFTAMMTVPVDLLAFPIISVWKRICKEGA